MKNLTETTFGLVFYCGPFYSRAPLGSCNHESTLISWATEAWRK